MKNLFMAGVKEELFSRIDKLTPQSKASWGKMNINQALRHMSLAFDIPSGKLNPTPSKIPPMPKWLLKFFLLHVKPPKETAATFKEMDTVANNINPADFDAERAQLKSAIELFCNSTSLLPENKIAGKFSKTDW